MECDREVAEDTKEQAVRYMVDRNRKELEEAAEQGLTVVIPDEYTLQIDIDSDEDHAAFLRLRTFFEALMFDFIKRVDSKPSRHGHPHYHITMTLTQPLGVWERIALQACFGSDRKRELYNAVRVLNNVPDPIVFFEKEV